MVYLKDAMKFSESWPHGCLHLLEEFHSLTFHVNLDPGSEFAITDQMTSMGTSSLEAH